MRAGDGAGGDPSGSHLPALDGLRGLAVAAVVAFHGGFGWAGGGFLGVSTFFTLSGFLITRLVLDEGRATGSISLRRFYARRVRRLWPASFLAIALVVAYARLVAGPSEVVGLRGDLLAALGQVANWWSVIEGRSYGDIFRAPSLVQHFWSLAVEEQFYLVLPPLLALAVRRRWPRSRLAVAAAAGIVLSMAATVALLAVGASTDRLYYGSDTRAVELLAGVLLAVVVSTAGAPGPGPARWLRWAGPAALVATVAAWAVADQQAEALYRGGLWAYAATSALLVAACTVPGPVTRALSAAPLRRLGEISYGLYLLHWPALRWLSAERLGTDRVTAFAIAVTAAVAASVVSYALLEHPIRRGAWGRSWSRWRPGAATAAATVALVALAVGVVVVVPRTEPAIDIEAAQAEIDSLETVDALPGAPVVAVFGDSTATATSLGLVRYSQSTGRIALRGGKTELGCGIVTSGEVRYVEGTGDLDSRCPPRDEAYRAGGVGTDLALLQFGPWDVADHRLPGDDTWRTVGDPVYDAHLIAEALRLIDLVTASGAVVLWVQPPRIELGTVDGDPPAEPYPTSDPARMARFHEIGEELARARPGRVVLVDLAGWMAGLPGGELDPELRPDGVHFTRTSAFAVTQRWLGPEIERIWGVVGPAR